MFKFIFKRDGRKVPYDNVKVYEAICKAMSAANRFVEEEAKRLTSAVEEQLVKQYNDNIPSVEDIQDTVEQVLMANGYTMVAKKYIIYRDQRTKSREMNTDLMKIFHEITNTDSDESDLKRDNANIDGDTAMGTMLKFGSEGAKDYFEKYVLTAEQIKAHRGGDIHIHDFDFYTLTTTCCQIDIDRLFKTGFSTGHGFLREPSNIHSYAALACIAIQSNQNDQHGGQSVPNFDYAMANGVAKTYKKLYVNNFIKAGLMAAEDVDATKVKQAFDSLIKDGLVPSLIDTSEYLQAEQKALAEFFTQKQYEKIRKFTKDTTMAETDKETFQAMEALVHNLNTMHSRAGAQTPFSSINYGLDTSPEGRLVIKNIMLATEAGLGFGETAIFPINIFRVKEGINYNKADPNYDLFRLAMRVSAKRLFPNFAFIDAPFNLKYYVKGRPETEVAYMGCRTRVIGNSYDPEQEITFGRGNLSFTSINLPRIALNSNHNIEWFFEELERKLDLCCRQMLDRFAIQSRKKVKNYPFLMGQGVWIGSEKLGYNDTIGEVLKHGTLSVGFIGLAETLVALVGSHHGQTAQARNLGLEIVAFMRDYLDTRAKETSLNFSLLATPAEGLSGRFVRIDAKKYGKIPGVTDRDYYTNSFHVPVHHEISAFDKIQIEAPYHEYTNAGHITYVELDGDTANNIDAFEKIVRCMKEAGIGYGSINHPVDRDSSCGYSGIINETCPKCGRDESSGIKFERIRRITGYLVGTLDRFNNAKRAEERERVKHGVKKD